MNVSKIRGFFLKINYFKITKQALNILFLIIAVNLSVPSFEKFISMYQATQKPVSLQPLVTMWIMFAGIMTMGGIFFSENIRRRYTDAFLISLFTSLIMGLGILAFGWEYLYFLLGYIALYLTLLSIEKYRSGEFNRYFEALANDLTSNRLNKVNEEKSVILKIDSVETSRVEMLERLYASGIHGGVKVDDEVRDTIDSLIQMIQKEWSLSKDLVPIEFLNQPLSKHIEYVRKKWDPYTVSERDCVSYPFEEAVGEHKKSLFARQMHTYVAALCGLEQGEVQNFFHEFSDFIHNYQQNIQEPVNRVEKQALATMIFYYKLNAGSIS